jgi:hypothetical protein
LRPLPCRPRLRPAIDVRGKGSERCQELQLQVRTDGRASNGAETEARSAGGLGCMVEADELPICFATHLPLAWVAWCVDVVSCGVVHGMACSPCDTISYPRGAAWQDGLDRTTKSHKSQASGTCCLKPCATSSTSLPFMPTQSMSAFFGQPLTDEEGAAVIHRAVELGCNFLDTSDVCKASRSLPRALCCTALGSLCMALWGRSCNG